MQSKRDVDATLTDVYYCNIPYRNHKIKPDNNKQNSYVLFLLKKNY